MIGLDLDDTLLVERSFLSMVYLEWATAIQQLKPELELVALHHDILCLHEFGGRQQLANRLHAKYALTIDVKAFVAHLLSLFWQDRCFSQLIWNDLLIEKLRVAAQSEPLVIVTNGKSRVQNKKIDALEQHSHLQFHRVICETIKKPDPSVAQNIPGTLRCYIGDSFVDQLFARHLRIPFCYPHAFELTGCRNIALP